jgi:hypothetical protein
MNIPYLLKILETDKVSELVANIEATPLDIDLALEDAQANGEIEVDKENDKIKVLKNHQLSCDMDLASKLIRTIQNYAKHETNITRGRMNALIKDPMTGQGYAWHDYITTLQFLIDDGQVIEEIVDVPEAKKNFVDKKGRKKSKVIRPAHKFAFLCLEGNDNQEWNARVVNKWIDDFAKVK